MRRVAWFDSPAYDAHITGRGHPERPERLRAVRDGMAARGLDTQVQRPTPQPIDPVGLHGLHAPEHVEAVRRLCAAGVGAIDPDTHVAAASWHAALTAAGAVVQAVDGVMLRHWERAFCSVRPPGHHATRAQAMGVCLFDNVAVGAEHALRHADVSRVAIVDWDVHHGNGTQDIFYERGDVLYASLHQYPFYPGTGDVSDKGTGAGEGTTLNCPVAAGEGDAAYWQAWQGSILPTLDAFSPDFLLISAGFDADARDPLAGLTLSAAGLTRLSAALVSWADAHCGGRIVSVLKGVYNLEALHEDVPLHVETLT